MQSKLQKILKKMKNQTEIENIQELKKMVEEQKAIKIFITPAENGFNVGIDNENSKGMNPSEHELVITIAKGLVHQAISDPHSTFLMGLERFKNDKEKKKELKKKQHNVIDFIDFLKKKYK